ncbi:MAG: 1,4-dihydroxy-6-naphthoate synthase [Nitrospirae bacterium]|nr:1,4-dihydroxy-6-naphthoate synthase [Nitrospirota bacterium]
MELSIGFSTCPNDTFIFYALVNNKIDTKGMRFHAILKDVEELNSLAFRGTLDITKVSYHTVGYILDEYCLLRSGGALGRGCGPLLVARERLSPQSLRDKKIAIPGVYTTAHLLLKLYDPDIARQVVAMPFFEIMRSLQKGDVDAGLIIHEGRFTYPSYGLKEIVDLGQWWEEVTGLPIPLGGIVAKRFLGKDRLLEIEKLIIKSIDYAYSHPEEVMPYIKSHAQEMEEEVIKQHISLYVNEFSLDPGEEGIKSIEYLLKRAAEIGILPHSKKPVFCT